MGYSHFERLSAVDAAFFAVEDGRAHMHIGSVNVFERGPLADEPGGVDIDRIRELVSVQLHKMPRFRQKLAYVPITQAPVWVDDPSFNLDYHVRHTALPHRGDAAQLKRLASRIMSQQLDRRRPLWEMWIVEGLEQDRFALISKIHHSMADGISGVDLFSAIVGRSPEFSPKPAPAWLPRAAPGARDLLVHEVRHQLGTLVGLVRGDARRGAAAADPHSPAQPLAQRLRQASAAVSAGLGTAPPTPLNVEIGPNRRFEWLRTSLEVLGDVRQASGATLNDVVLAIVTGAVRGFLLRRGCSVRELDFRAMVPVSVRTADERGRLGNRVSQLVVHLPLEAEAPLERLRIVNERTRELKKSGQAEGGRMLTGLSELLPPVMAGALERVATRYSFGNMIVTNVPGARFTAYLLGARLVESYPLVPLFARQGLNIASV